VLDNIKWTEIKPEFHYAASIKRPILKKVFLLFSKAKGTATAVEDEKQQT
jgi:hypothetical protein